MLLLLLFCDDKTLQPQPNIQFLATKVKGQELNSGSWCGVIVF
jgi:hypothetical protein